MTEQDGLICAYRLDGEGGGERYPTLESIPERSGAHLSWIHLNRSAPQAQQWLRRESGLPPLICDALLAEETRPRCAAIEDGILLNLRGVNLNPESDPEDMVSIRVWLQTDRIISCRTRQLMAVSDLLQSIESGQGPRETGGFVITIAERLTARMDPVIDALEDKLDELEDTSIQAPTRELRSELAEVRRETIMLRRYIAPQRDALRHLAMLEGPSLSPSQRDRLNEIADTVTRYIEDLDVIRDRATVMNDEVANRIAERMDKTMLILSLVTLIFLPLTVISGLLGMNVGGIPGGDSPWAFAIVCLLFVAIGAFQVWLFRRLKWWL
ncbi:MAG: zinc transporter ZntB [Pseudomonadota bacterium]